MRYLIFNPDGDNTFTLDGKLHTLKKEPVDGLVVVQEFPNRILFKVPGSERIYTWTTGHHSVTLKGEMRMVDTNINKFKRVNDYDLDELLKQKPTVGNSHMNIDSEYLESEDEDFEIEGTYLRDIQWDPKMFVPIRTGTVVDQFISRVGGFLPATNIMVTGDPGIGKSSNMMEFLVKAREQNPDIKVAYVSAEMEAEDLKEFIQFYPDIVNIPFLMLGDYLYNDDDNRPIWKVLQAFLAPGFDFVVFDSLIEIQSIIQEELQLPQKKGEAWMLKLIRSHNKGYNKSKSYTCFLSIQQKNKGGQYVGSKRLEHMTTAFLQLLWDTKEKGKRYMVFEKNRKGKEKVRLYYSFDNTGTGVKYDAKRYEIELDILERLQATPAEGIDNMTSVDFEDLFNEHSRNEEL